MELNQLAYRIHTPRLVLRCMGPEDAQRRMDAVNSSGAHLADFFDQREKPITLEMHAATIRRFRGYFDSDGDRPYGAFDPQSGELLGESGLMVRPGFGALEVSYWVAARAAGRGLASEMAQAMVKVGFELHHAPRLDIYCRAENVASAALARKLGFTLDGRLRNRQLASHHPVTDLLCFTLLASEYAQTAAKSLPIELFDFLDRPIALAG